MEEDRQTHTLPISPARLNLLARKMPGDGAGGIPDGEALNRRLQEHLSAVREIYHRVVHAFRQPPYAGFEERPARPEEVTAPPPDSNLDRVLGERAPRLAAALAAAYLRRGRARFETFLEQAAATPELLARLEASPDGVLDIFEHSAHFADQLLRYPELLEEIEKPFQLEGGPLQDAAALRRFYRRQMLRIQCESMLGRAPIFETLGKTSVLADSVIAAAYRIALAEAPPPSGANYRAHDQMMVMSFPPPPPASACASSTWAATPTSTSSSPMTTPSNRSSGPASPSASSRPSVPTPVKASCSPSIPASNPTDAPATWFRPRAPTRPTSPKRPRLGKASPT